MKLLSMFRSVTIRARMIGNIGLVLTLLALLGATGTLGMLRIQDASQTFVQKSSTKIQKFGEIRDVAKSLRANEDAVILGVERAEMLDVPVDQWNAIVKGSTEQVKDLKALPAVPAEQALMVIIESGLSAYTGKLKTLMSDAKEGKLLTSSEIRVASGQARQSLAQAEQSIKKLDTLVREQAKEAESAYASEVQRTIALFAAVGVLAAVIIVPLTLANLVSIVQPIRQARALALAIAEGDLTTEVHVTGRDEAADLLEALQRMQSSLGNIVGQVREASSSIAVASGEVASGSLDLSQRTEQTAGNLQQTASSMEQLTGTARHSAEAAGQANHLASSASAVAKRGGQVVSQVVHTMSEINNSSKKIADIIGVIDGIAFQTNILALNAAVEAARAGEQGRGFAVVATEVRNLAQRSANAAKEIKGLIGVSVDKVESGSRMVADAGATMDEIVGSVQRVSDIIGEIADVSSQQSSGISQLNGSVGQLDQMTQQNAALVEQSSAAAESLKEQANRLAQVVSVFKLAPA
ncbi:MAG: methyl-accepting chemotaxis protein [Burkholderiales bacterium]